MDELFRVYLKEDKEIIEYGKPDKPTRLEYAFGDTLLAFLDFDAAAHGRLFEEIIKPCVKSEKKKGTSAGTFGRSTSIGSRLYTLTHTFAL